MIEVDQALARMSASQPLSRDEARHLFGRIVAGDLDPVQMSALLTALKAKGERPDEIAGAAEALLNAAAPFPAPAADVADTCGTGGDGLNTVNISTAVALVAAAAGLGIVKHGNRAVSSRCGSADVLEAAGVRIDIPADRAARCLADAGICFLFAPLYHQGVRHAMPVRKALGVRTIFNVLGPLINPARPAYQLMGVYDPALCAPLAEVLGRLGRRKALVVHGSGMDEIAVHGPTDAALWDGERVVLFQITPEQAGLPRHPAAALAGGGPADNAGWLHATLAGRGSPAHNSAVAINAGALLWIAGRAESLRHGTRAALDLLAGGAAQGNLALMAECSHAA